MPSVDSGFFEEFAKAPFGLPVEYEVHGSSQTSLLFDRCGEGCTQNWKIWTIFGLAGEVQAFS